MTEWRGVVIGDGCIRVEGPVRDGWYAVGTYLMHQGMLKLAEVSVFPGEDRPLPCASEAQRWDDPGRNPFSPTRHLPGQWSRQVRALDQVSPPAAINMRLLRSIDLGQMTEKARETAVEAEWIADQMARLPDPDNEYARRVIATLRSTMGATGSPVGRAPDIRIAEFARGYAQVSARTPTPVRQLMVELDWPRTRVKQFVDEARARGYLTSPGQGRRRSDLTAAAVEILDRNDPGSPTPIEGTTP